MGHAAASVATISYLKPRVAPATHSSHIVHKRVALRTAYLPTRVRTKTSKITPMRKHCNPSRRTSRSRILRAQHILRAFFAQSAQHILRTQCILRAQHTARMECILENPGINKTDLWTLCSVDSRPCAVMDMFAIAKSFLDGDIIDKAVVEFNSKFAGQEGHSSRIAHSSHIVHSSRIAQHFHIRNYHDHLEFSIGKHDTIGICKRLEFSGGEAEPAVPAISKFIASRIRKEISHNPPSTCKDGRFIRPLTQDELNMRKRKLMQYDKTHGARHMTNRKRDLMKTLRT